MGAREVPMAEELRRVYLSATLPILAQMWTQGAWRLAEPAHGHAVTAALREWYAEGDQDELEYVAFSRAAEDSLLLLQADQAASRRRVVISVDIADVSPAGAELASSRVRLGSSVSVTDVAAVHVDGASATADVAAAAEWILLAAQGDPAAQQVVEAVEEHELEWYDVSEVPTLLAGLPGPA
jgi:uncharacterized protein DUF6912